MTCYLCEPPPGYPPEGDQDAIDTWNEACNECDAHYWSNPVVILADTGGAA